MTRRRGLLASALLAVLALTGCTEAADGSPPAAAPSTVTTGTAPTGAPPSLAGRAEAEALSRLPAGPATGTAVVAYAGAGELRAPFQGECTHVGDATRVEGSADTAQIRLDVTPDGARLALDDLDVSATSELTTGRYDVSGSRLTLVAGLAAAGQRIGTVELQVDCGS